MPRLSRQWEPKTIAAFNKGMQVSYRADTIEDEALLLAQNVVIRKNQVEADRGHKDFGDTLLGTPRASYQFFRRNGSSDLVCVTDVSFYKFDTVNSQWEFVPSGNDTTTAGTAAAAATSIDFTSVANFAVNDWAGIRLDNGVQWKVKITAIVSTTVSFTGHPIPASRSVALGAEVVKPVELSGTQDNHVCILTVASFDWCVFTNNIDPPQRYDGSTCETVPGLPNSGNIKARWLALYNNSLFLINTEEGGTSYPQRIRRCAAGDLTNWSTLDAGYDDLYEDSDYCMAAEILGPYLIVYKERAIVRGEYIGTGGLNYKFETVVRGEGLFTSAGVTDLGDKHFFIGQTNFYEFRGGFDIEPIGDAVFYRYFGVEAIVDPSYRERTFLVYAEEVDEVWCFMPLAGSETCNMMVRYNVAEKTFAERLYTVSFAGYGFWQQQNSIPWSALVGTWADQTWKWNARELLANSPTMHLCCVEDLIIKEHDYVVGTDDGAPIASYVETKDFLLPYEKFRTDMFEMDVQGLNINFQFSLDKGETWETVELFNRFIFGRYRCWKQIVGEQIRFRWTSGDATFRLGYFGFTYKSESTF